MEEENNAKGQLALTVGSKRAFCGFRCRNFYGRLEFCICMASFADKINNSIESVNGLIVGLTASTFLIISLSTGLIAHYFDLKSPA